MLDPGDVDHVPLVPPLPATALGREMFGVPPPSLDCFEIPEVGDGDGESAGGTGGVLTEEAGDFTDEPGEVLGGAVVSAGVVVGAEGAEDDGVVGGVRGERRAVQRYPSDRS